MQAEQPHNFNPMPLRRVLYTKTMRANTLVGVQRPKLRNVFVFIQESAQIPRHNSSATTVVV
jgi:hypothetical protein